MIAVFGLNSIVGIIERKSQTMEKQEYLSTPVNCYDYCEHLNLNEAEQTSNNVPHYCEKYKKQLYHYKTRERKSESLLKCDQCLKEVLKHGTRKPIFNNLIANTSMEKTIFFTEGDMEKAFVAGMRYMVKEEHPNLTSYMRKVIDEKSLQSEND